MDLIKFADELYQYLLEAGIKFTEEGYPIISDDMLLKEMPEKILPIGHVRSTEDKSRVLLVSFSNDENIYKRLMQIKKEAPGYREYLGVGGFDLSPRINWDINLQKFNILLSMLANAFLALNGVRIMANFRTGCSDTMGVLQCYPRNGWFVVGALGCSRGRIKINEMYLREKLILTNPDKLIYYGSLKQEYRIILEEIGIDYVVFPDYQWVSRGKEVL